MKALMVNSLNNSNIIQTKMRDELYMRHLREVQKINNRSPEQIAHDLKTYKSINQLHQKHKSYAFDWNHKQQNAIIEQNNGKIQKKIREIRSYFNTKSNHQCSQHEGNLKQSSVKDPQTQMKQKQQQQKQTSSQKRQKKRISLHYRYRQKRQQQIAIENEKLQKGILSQRSSYHLPRIGKVNRSVNSGMSKLVVDVKEGDNVLNE